MQPLTSESLEEGTAYPDGQAQQLANGGLKNVKIAFFHVIFKVRVESVWRYQLLTIDQ